MGYGVCLRVCRLNDDRCNYGRSRLNDSCMMAGKNDASGGCERSNYRASQQDSLQVYFHTELLSTRNAREMNGQMRSGNEE